MNSRGFEFSFSWIFAMIAGSVIIFLAIYAAINFSTTERDRIQAEAGEQLGILLNPVETNLESGKYYLINFQDEARFHNRCRILGNFGEQGISLELRSSIGEEWQRSDVESRFNGKYIFSKNIEQGEELHLFVQPFYFPYKVGDLILASSDNFCFVNAPDNVKEDIEALGVRNINFSSSSCGRESIEVCFSRNGCDINVNLIEQSVEKDGDKVYYEENLLYGAIFADPEVYECQVQRLMKRTAELAQLYASKSEFLSGKGCSSGMTNELITYASSLVIDKSSDIRIIYELSQDIERRNTALICKLF